MPQLSLFALLPCGLELIGDLLHLSIAVALVFVVLSTFLRPMITSQKGKKFTDFVEHRGPMLLGFLIAGLLCGTIGNFFDKYSELNPTPEMSFVTGAPVQSNSDNANEESEGLSPYWSDKFYLSWTQFFADGTVTPRDSFWTRIGRMFGLAFLSLLAYEAYAKLFAQEILDAVIMRQRNHTLICGAGRIGTVLAKNLLQDKSKDNNVTVIEKDPNSPALDELRDLGANVMIADATIRRNLERAGCERAREIFVVTGSDEANLDITMDVIYSYRASGKSNSMPKIHVHLNHMRLERIISELIEKDTNEEVKKELRTQIGFFNPLEESMRDLFDDEVLLRRPKYTEEVAHYVIVGFGYTGQQLALFLAENAHFENLKRPRMTIVYRCDEQAAVDRFRGLYPKFFPQPTRSEGVPINSAAEDDQWRVDARMDAWEFGVELVKMSDSVRIDYSQSNGVEFAVNGSFVRMDGGCTSPSFIENLYKLCQEPNVRPMVFICHADDEENCAEAIELRQVMDDRLKPKAKAENPRPTYANPDHEVSIIAYVPDHPSLSKLLNANKGTHVADRVAWGDCEESCKHIRLETDIIKNLADKIAEAYGTKKEELPFLTAWELSSNRKAAIHLNAKLAVIDWRIISPAKKRGAIEMTQNQFEHEIAEAIEIIDRDQSDPSSKNEMTMKMIIMAKMEHHRWLAERVLQDWSLGLKSDEQVESRKLETRKRPSFVDWGKTAKKDKKYNIEQIEKSFEFLDEMLKDSNEKPTESVKENVKLFTIHKRTHQATEDPHPPVDPAT